MKIIAAKYLIPIYSEPIKNGYIKLDDQGTIIEIGTYDSNTMDADYYDGIICPGFTNAHCHVELSHMKGIFKENTGMSGFINQINALRLTIDKQGRINALKEQLQYMYNQGISAMGDICNCDESFEAKSKSKIFTRNFIELFGTFPDEAEKVISEGNVIKEQAESYNLKASLTPHSCYTTSSKLIAMAAAEGLKEGYISYHNQESIEEEELLIKGTGPLADNYKGRNLMTPPITGKPALLYFIDSLRKKLDTPINGKILLVHNTATNEESIDYALNYLKEPFWVICPLSNYFIHRVLPPLDIMRKKNLSICVGTDSLSSNKILSIIEELKCIQNNFNHIELPEMLKWACINGATAIGKEKTLGTFEIGKKPGVVFIDKITDNLKLTEESSSHRIY